MLQLNIIFLICNIIKNIFLFSADSTFTTHAAPTTNQSSADDYHDYYKDDYYDEDSDEGGNSSTETIASKTAGLPWNTLFNSIGQGREMIGY